MPKRFAIARLSHEGNSFSPVLTGRAGIRAPRSALRQGKNHFRAAFTQSFAQLIDADTPGPG